MDNSKKALKSGVWYTIGNFVTKGFIFIVSPIFNRIMSPTDVGIYSNFTAWIAILSIVCTLDLYSALSVARFDFRDELNEFVTSILLLGSLITSGFYVIALVFWDDVRSLLGFSSLELHIAMLYFLVSPSLQIFQLKSRIEYKYKLSTLVSLLSTLCATGISLICVLAAEEKLAARIIGNYVPLILLNGIMYIFFFQKAKGVSVKYWKYALTISIPMAIHLLSGNILGSSDRIMITSMC